MSEVRTVWSISVEVRIGVTYSAREIELQLSDDTDRDALKKKIETALANEAGILWLEDRKGREVAIPSAKISYVDLGSDLGVRPMGFSS